jgi:hypothetical protein
VARVFLALITLYRMLWFVAIDVPLSIFAFPPCALRSIGHAAMVLVAPLDSHLSPMGTTTFCGSVLPIRVWTRMTNTPFLITGQRDRTELRGTHRWWVAFGFVNSL